MTENSEISALYPPPPPYYKFFTSENISRVNELRKNNDTDVAISKLTDLKFLIPPKQPEKEQYRSFGDLWWFQDKQVGLKESGIEQIYGESEHPKDDEDDEEEDVFSTARIDELKKMTKSLLYNYLEFISVLIKNPEFATEKIENIRTILINIHHLLNSYRLHQSRETLIITMQKKLSETQDEISTIKNTCSNIETKLNLLMNKLNDGKSLNVEKAKPEENIEEPSEPEKMYTIPNILRKEAEEALTNQFTAN